MTSRVALVMAPYSYVRLSVRTKMCQLIHMQTRQLIHFKRINLFRLRRCGTESSRPTSSGVRRS